MPRALRAALVLVFVVGLAMGCGGGSPILPTTGAPDATQAVQIPTPKARPAWDVDLPGDGARFVLDPALDPYGHSRLEVQIVVPRGTPTLDLSILDGAAEAGQAPVPAEYVLDADPLGTGQGMRRVATRMDQDLPDETYADLHVDFESEPGASARAANEHHVFRLTVRLLDPSLPGRKTFALRVRGLASLPPQSFGLLPAPDATGLTLQVEALSWMDSFEIHDANLGYGPPYRGAEDTPTPSYRVTHMNDERAFVNETPSADGMRRRFFVSATGDVTADLLTTTPLPAGTWRVEVRDLEPDRVTWWELDHAVVSPDADAQVVRSPLPQEIRGRVQTSATDAGLEAVSVHLLDAQGRFLDGATTDEEGLFAFGALPGRYEVAVAADSYRPDRALAGCTEIPPVDVTLDEGEVAPVVFEAALSFDGIVGIGDRALSMPVWYVVADGGGSNGGNDWLFTVDVTLPAPASGQNPVGLGTGTNNVEAVAFWPGTDILYAANASNLGTIDIVNGTYTRVSTNNFGSARGSAGTISITDVDSLGFDPHSGVLFGTHRRNGSRDLLLQIDTATGLVIPDAFGSGVDYVVVQEITPGNNDIDDLAVDPYDGQMYACANGGGFADRLVKVNKQTGAVMDVGPMLVNDMEGLSFYNDGSLWGTTGSTRSVYLLNKGTGVAGSRRPLNPGSDFESLAFLTLDTNSITGTVYEDRNVDAVFDTGEPGRSGVDVQLWRDVNLDGIVTPGVDFLLTTKTTDATGGYAFEIASLGDFVIYVDASTLPPNSTLTTTDTHTASFGGGGEIDAGNDYGLFLPGTIGDRVWHDANANGTQDGGETGLAGVVLTLTYLGLDGVLGGGDDVVYPTQTSDAAGAYDYTVLPPGAYLVDAGAPPPSYMLTSGNDPLTVTLSWTQDYNAADFGYVLATASIGDRVWNDLDGDGTQDAGEPGLAGVTLTLTWLGPDGVLGGGDDVVYPTQTTDGTGAFDFSSLPPGTYIVDPGAPPAGYVLTGGIDPLTVTILEGEDLDTADFGYVLATASIGDRVWSDIDGDGTQDVGEPDLAGVTLTLTWLGPDGVLGGGDDVVYPTQTTDATGAYDFTGLIQGAYVVDASTVPTGYVLTGGTDPLGVTLTAGQDLNTADFGYQPRNASIGDRVWADLDGDGTQDAGEPGLAGVTLTLTYLGADGVPGGGDDVVYPTQTTDATGAYDFTGLPAGAYVVDASTVPADHVLTGGTDPQSITLMASQTLDTADFGYQPRNASIGDRVWNDLDGNGLQDAGEPGLAGVTLTLTYLGADGVPGGGDDVVYPAQTTDATGAYDFTGLPPGTYVVDASTVPAGFALTGGTDPLTVTITASQVLDTADLGYILATASIGDFVWIDLDGDGTQDAGELGLAGVTLTLTNLGLDGVLGGGDDIVYPTQTTPATGAYDFTGLPAGSYLVDASTVPAGYVLTGGTDPLGVTLAAAQDFDTADFGYQPRNASIGDRVWTDLNGDGVQDAGEPGLAGVTLTLTWLGPDGVAGGGDDVVYPTQTTDASGAYDFVSLPPGNHVVAVSTVPAGHVLTGGTAPSTVTLTAAQDLDTVDFGYQPRNASIGDRIWDDLDGNGVQDAGEPGLPGVVITLTWLGPDGVPGGGDDVVYPTQTSDASGAYDFTGLPPGNYVVDTGTPPAGYVLTGGTDPLPVTLLASQTLDTADFGFVLSTASIGDFVWSDVNGDGTQDAGEPGLPGVVLTLTYLGLDGVPGGGDDVVFPTQSSNASGAYDFTGLLPGTYVVDAGTPPASYVLTGGTDPLTVTITAAQDLDTADFGYQPRNAAIGDRVWSDVDGDGTQDVGEAGLAGVTLTLTWLGPDGVLGGGDDVVYPTQTSDASGAYGFTGLPAGAYLVDAGAPPAGYVLTGGTDPLPVTITASQAFDTADFGFQPRNASIGDRVWIDVDGDGAQDAGEVGLPGVVLTLTNLGPDGVLGGGDDTVYPTQTSDGSGAYDFLGLPAGAYHVDAGTPPAGYVLTGGTDPLVVTITAGRNYDSADFGFQPRNASIGDRVWTDLDGDGTQDAGEPGLAGVTLTLTWLGLDGVPGGGDDIVYPPQITDATGAYTFTGLPPGNFVVDPGTAPVDHALTGGTDPLTLTLTASQVLVTADFGYQPQNASIGDRVWNDQNADGVQDAGEPALAGVTLTLTWYGPDGVLGGGDDVVYPTQTTGAAGAYDFLGLPQGTYAVDASTVPAGYVLTGGTDPQVVTIAASQNLDTADFGYVLSTASIGDRIWDDLDGNGLQDAGEPGLAGVTLTLTWFGPDGVPGGGDDVVYPTQTTNATGAYDFVGLPPGTFQVDVSTVPAGYVLTGGTDPRAVVLAAAQDVNDADFGYQLRTASIGDRIWNDQNANGVQDVGEPGLAGVPVTLTNLGPDGVLGGGDDVVYPVQSSNALGDYDFTALPTGLYRVDPGTPPAGFSLVAGTDPQTVALAAAQDFDLADFGYATALASIGDRVWSDADANGVQDAGEPGLDGVTLRLREAGPDGILATPDDVTSFPPLVTAGGGAYLFTALLPGTYLVTVDATTVPADHVLTTGNDPFPVLLTQGQAVLDADFGYQPQNASIGDRVWNDLDLNGLQDALEPGLAGVTLTLTYLGADGVLGGGDDVVFPTQVTDASGAYDFTGLIQGAYVVDASTVPAGYVLTGGTDPLTVGLVASQNLDTADFGYVLSTASIGDRVWDDLDGNGLQDAGEPGLAGVTLTLVYLGLDGVVGGGDDVVFPTQTTNASGAYDFTTLPPGTYVVDAGTPPAGYVLTGGTDPLEVTITAGQDLDTVDFGFQLRTASIGDRAWVDLDGNGAQDAGEPGLPGVPFVLTNLGLDGVLGGGDDTVYPTQITSAAGAYDFTGLPTGTYLVDPGTPPAGFLLVAGTDPLTVSIAAGQDLDTADFGYATSTASVGDRVWSDIDGDTVQDAGEPGIDGVTLRLREAGTDGVLGTPDDVTAFPPVTTAGGAYLFTGLLPGIYLVEVDAGTVPTDYFLTTGNDPLPVLLSQGEAWLIGDFGYQPRNAAIGDRVWNDLDGDGTQDAGEPGLAGVVLTLTHFGLDGVLGGGDDTVYPTQTTTSTGAYGFQGLPAGTYRVDPGTPPTGWVLTGGTDPWTVTIVPAQDLDTVDFGYQRRDARIGDRVWHDVDRDGAQDPGEPGLSGVRVTLRGAGPDGQFSTADDITTFPPAFTSATGAYLFGNLPTGRYRVDVDETTLPAEHTDLMTGNEPLVVDLAAGQAFLSADFGYAELLYVIGDLVWLDSDADGVYEPGFGELPLPGVIVNLRNAAGAIVATTVTNALGRYTFTVTRGSYVVEIDPDNLQPGGALESYTSTSGGMQQPGVVLGANARGIDFGFRPVVSPATARYCEWWQANPSAWPLQQIRIGGKTYSQSQALQILESGNLIYLKMRTRAGMSMSSKLDVTVVLAWAIIGAKLNIANGVHATCVQELVEEADLWLQAVGGVGAGIKISNPSFQQGYQLCQKINDFNERGCR